MTLTDVGSSKMTRSVCSPATVARQPLFEPGTKTDSTGKPGMENRNGLIVDAMGDASRRHGGTRCGADHGLPEMAEESAARSARTHQRGSRQGLRQWVGKERTI